MFRAQKIYRSASFPPLLNGFRVFLRPPRLSDWKEWQRVRVNNRAFLKPFEPAWDTDALTKSWFERRTSRQAREREAGTSVAFLIFKKENGALIGGININHICRGAAQYGSLGYWIEEQHQGQGYMAEALRLTLKHAFEDLKLHRVHAACIPDNPRSKNLLLRARFKEEGFAEKYIEIDGRWQDHVLFGITAEDWNSGPAGGTG